MFTPYDRNNKRENKQFGGFFLQAFFVRHGETNNYGLLIRHKNGETALFITDFLYTEYRFAGCKINSFFIECNYQDKYVDKDAPNFQHKIGDHCSYKTCKEFLKVNQTENMRNVILVHMGGATCDINECCDDLQNTLGETVKVDYARKGETYQL